MHSKLSPVAPAFVPSYAMVLPSLAAGQLVAQTTGLLNVMDNPTKKKCIEIVAKRYELGVLVEDPLDAFGGDLGFDIFNEEDEEVLDECFA